MIHADKTDLLVGHQSFVGTVVNGDNYAITPFRPINCHDPIATLAVVAEGMMNRRLNKIASEMVISAIVEVFEQSASLEPRKLLTEAMAAASEKVAQYRKAHPEVMGVATCAATLIMDKRLYTVSIGNCRIYFLRQKRLRQISTDHTIIQMLIDQGHATIEELERGLPMDGFPLARCFGMEPYGASRYDFPDFRLRLDKNESDEQANSNQGLHLQKDDRILLCTAGLHGSLRSPATVKDQEIQKVLLRHSHPQQVADALVALAKQHRGEYQDITVIVLKIPGENRSEQ